MKKCSCYREIPNDKYGRCNGTRECDICGCGGDEAKCDFYPEKRKAAEKLAWAEDLKSAAKNLIAYAEMAINENVDFGDKGRIIITIDIPLAPNSEPIRTKFAMSCNLFMESKGE